MEFGSRAAICGEGMESVAVSYGRSIIKCYSKSRFDPTALRASSHEIRALQAFGGYQGACFRTPLLQGYALFDKAFRWNGREFICLARQTRMNGSVLQDHFDGERLGYAIGEFHQLLSRKLKFFTANDLSIPGYAQGLKDKMRYLPASLKDRLERGIRKAIQRSGIHPVHGDLHPFNVIDDGSCYGIVDLSMTGLAIRELDLAAVAGSPDMVRDVSAGYAQATGIKPRRRSIEICQAFRFAVLAQQQPDRRSAAPYISQLQAILS